MVTAPVPQFTVIVALLSWKCRMAFDPPHTFQLSPAVNW
jgi:hypothetical protein